MMAGLFGRRRFKDLSEQEVLALAITSEEDDAQIYRWYAESLRPDYPASASALDEMAGEEDGHRRRLIEMHQKRFGPVIPLIRREHIAGYYTRRPVWLIEKMGVTRIREEAARMEADARDFYVNAAKVCPDGDVRLLLGDLAAAEAEHEDRWNSIEETDVPRDVRSAEDAAAHRQFILTYVQPGLAGLMDGSVSTLAPIFAAAFATGDTWQTFLVGLAASIGAGISMGFTEAASDDGVISGRGSPLLRGITTGVMTTIGGLGHALPYLIPHFWTATIIAFTFVAMELWAIAWVQKHFMQTPFWRATLQVVVGGALVLAAGVLIGQA
ncbi:iron exporter MbfA [Acuticoccus mangrovi]|uniref:Rubrerythrin family protein n=1 Tax=Acuticoccus mangrovi TaxID=2796142 RepID=A0A934MIB0_9HYPH|nr:ferritin family protein [Acuticoccus mangrovi]MBJ3777745.1 rubrerythrin family protein [Acuticoccus mangrovi]